jgi:hypothetical protein
MDEYVKFSNKQSRSQYFLWEGKVNVYNSKHLPEDVDIERILKDISIKIPSHLLNGIESILVGEFEHMREKEVDSMYQDGAIYIYPDYVHGEQDLKDDIIHEIAHSLEEAYSADIYGDGQLEREFIIKRMQLFNALQSTEIPFFPRDFFLSPDYSKEFDEYLYKTVGYPLLTSLTTNMFVSPYGATSLREYFANGFEEYFTGNINYVRDISPAIYKKIVNLIKLEEEF